MAFVFRINRRSDRAKNVEEAFLFFSLQKGVATITEKIKKQPTDCGAAKGWQNHDKNGEAFLACVFFLRAAATADNLARLNQGYRTKWHSPQQKLLADNIKKRWLQRYANKIIGEERAVIFLRLAAVGVFNCSYWRNDNCCNCLRGIKCSRPLLPYQSISIKTKKAPKG